MIRAWLSRLKPLWSTDAEARRRLGAFDDRMEQRAILFSQISSLIVSANHEGDSASATTFKILRILEAQSLI